MLNDVNLNIPEHKVTAIVGASGSGKTTLIKLMLGFYTPNKGDIKIGETPLDVVNPHLWRAKSGSVMQDALFFLIRLQIILPWGRNRWMWSAFAMR